MDISKLTTNDWLLAGGALGMLVFGLFVDWISVDVAFGSVSGGNAFDFFFTGTIPWLLVVAAGVVTVLRTQGKIGENLPWNLLVVAATGLGAILLILRVLINPGFDGAGRGMGMYLSLLSAVAAAAGGFLSFQAAGGTLSDLTDVDKIKGAFDQGGQASQGGQDGQGGGEMPPPPPPPPPA